MQNDNETFNRWDYITNIDEIRYSCEVGQEVVIFGECGDDPHGLNNEASMSFKEFLENKTGISNSCRSHIKKYFGDEKLERFIFFVEEKYKLLNK